MWQTALGRFLDSVRTIFQGRRYYVSMWSLTHVVIDFKKPQLPPAFPFFPARFLDSVRTMLWLLVLLMVAALLFILISISICSITIICITIMIRVISIANSSMNVISMAAAFAFDLPRFFIYSPNFLPGFFICLLSTLYGPVVSSTGAHGFVHMSYREPSIYLSLCIHIYIYMYYVYICVYIYIYMCQPFGETTKQTCRYRDT